MNPNQQAAVNDTATHQVPANLLDGIASITGDLSRLVNPGAIALKDSVTAIHAELIKIDLMEKTAHAVQTAIHTTKWLAGAPTKLLLPYGIFQTEFCTLHELVTLRKALRDKKYKLAALTLALVVELQLGSFSSGSALALKLMVAFKLLTLSSLAVTATSFLALGSGAAFSLYMAIKIVHASHAALKAHRKINNPNYFLSTHLTAYKKTLAALKKQPKQKTKIKLESKRDYLAQKIKAIYHANEDALSEKNKQSVKQCFSTIDKATAADKLFNKKRYRQLITTEKNKRQTAVINAMGSACLAIGVATMVTCAVVHPASPVFLLIGMAITSMGGGLKFSGLLEAKMHKAKAKRMKKSINKRQKHRFKCAMDMHNNYQARVDRYADNTKEAKELHNKLESLRHKNPNLFYQSQALQIRLKMKKNHETSANITTAVLDDYIAEQHPKESAENIMIKHALGYTANDTMPEQIATLSLKQRQALINNYVRSTSDIAFNRDCFSQPPVKTSAQHNECQL
jgi:hypothetical protein